MNSPCPIPGGAINSLMGVDPWRSRERERRWVRRLPEDWPRLDPGASGARRVLWSAEVAVLGGSGAAGLFVSYWLRNDQRVPLAIWMATAPLLVFAAALGIRRAIDALDTPTRPRFRWSYGWLGWFGTIAVLLASGVGALRLRTWEVLPGAAMGVVGLILLVPTVAYLRKPVHPTCHESSEVPSRSRAREVTSSASDEHR